MELLLTVRNNNGAAQESDSHCFDEAGGTIGRSLRNDWTLVDPERYISERHARIKFREGAFELVDLSTNGTYLNDDRRRIRRNDSVVLESGDELSMGTLQIEVRIVGGPTRMRGSPDAHREASHKSGGGDTLPLGQLKAEEGGTADQRQPEPGQMAKRSADRSPGSQNPPGLSGIPEEWRSLATSFFRPTAGRAGKDGGSQDRHKATEGTTHGDAATRAMLRELGIEELGTELDAEALGREAGRILRMVAAGLMEALNTRAQVKDRFRIQPTRIRAAGNNPLKSSGTLESALQHVFRQEQDDIYIRGAPAFREAFEDLHIHELAMLSAVHASIEGVIADFDPGPLKNKLRQVAPVSAATPVLSSARCWNLYEAHYMEVAAQLRDDARFGFLREFAKAYESATEQLRTNSKPDGERE